MSARCSWPLVLFDLDGTLVDHDGAAAEAVERWLTDRGWADPASLPGLVREWDAIAELHFTAYRAGLTTFQGQRRRRLLDFLPAVGITAGSWSEECLDNVFRTYLIAYEAAWRAFPDAAACLGALRQRTRVAVLSNGDQVQQEAKVCRTGLGPMVEVILTSDQLGAAKPDPEIFLLACRRLGVSAREAVYVGDRIELDARAASAAGLRGIWLNRAGGEVPPGIESIDDLSALPGLLGES